MATEQDIRQLEYAFEHDSEIDEQAEPSIRIRKGTGLQSFHGCLWEILRNPLMKQIWEATVPPSNAITALPLIVPVRQESYKAEMRKQHGNILKAVKDHDPNMHSFTCFSIATGSMRRISIISKNSAVKTGDIFFREPGPGFPEKWNIKPLRVEVQNEIRF